MIDCSTLQTSTCATISRPISVINALGLTGLSLIARGGAQTINGCAGNDTLSGGGGRDTFVFSHALSPANVDTILDFSSGIDRIRLDDDVFKALSAGTALTDAQFHAGASATSAHDADDRIIYDTSSLGASASAMMFC